MDKYTLENAFAAAAQVCLADVAAWAGCRFSGSATEGELTFPSLTAEVQSMVPLSGRSWIGTVICGLICETAPSGPDPFTLEFATTPEGHIARVSALARLLAFRGLDYLAALESAGAGQFQCPGFTETESDYTIANNRWRGVIRVTAGIEWARS